MKHYHLAEQIDDGELVAKMRLGTFSTCSDYDLQNAVREIGRDFGVTLIPFRCSCPRRVWKEIPWIPSEEI